MHIVQARQPRFVERQASVPEFVHHPSAGSRIHAVELYRQLAVQMPHKIAMRRIGIFEADHEMVMISEESPCLKNKPVVFRQLKGCISERSSFAWESKSRFRCSVAAVTM